MKNISIQVENQSAIIGIKWYNLLTNDAYDEKGNRSTYRIFNITIYFLFFSVSYNNSWKQTLKEIGES